MATLGMQAMLMPCVPATKRCFIRNSLELFMNLSRISAILGCVTVPDPMTVSSTTPRSGVPQRKARSRGFSRPLPVWWRDACWVFVWSSILVVVALWVAGGGVQGLAQVGTALTSVGRLTGLLASDLLLIQVLLMLAFSALGFWVFYKFVMAPKTTLTLHNPTHQACVTAPGCLAWRAGLL